MAGVPTRDGQYKVFRCGRVSNGRVWVHSPLRRGVVRWVREQARLAVADSTRPWSGAVAEYERLKAGKHPDPDPAALIFRFNPKLYDPNRLEIDAEDLELADWAALWRDTEPINDEASAIPFDRHKVTRDCYKQLDETVGSQESRLAERMEFDLENNDWLSAEETYSPTKIRLDIRPDFVSYYRSTHNSRAPLIHSPLYIGIIRWLRFKALRAAHESDRQWKGALTEYERLCAGTHPDSNPGNLIFYYNPDLYDPNRLEIDIEELRQVDRLASEIVAAPGYQQPNSQSCGTIALPHESYHLLDNIMQEHNQTLAMFAAYDMENDDQLPEDRIYSPT